MCNRTSYEKKWHALRVAIELCEKSPKKIRKKHSKFLGVFRCAECNAWHLDRANHFKSWWLKTEHGIKRPATWWEAQL